MVSLFEIELAIHFFPNDIITLSVFNMSSGATRKEMDRLIHYVAILVQKEPLSEEEHKDGLMIWKKVNSEWFDIHYERKLIESML